MRDLIIGMATIFATNVMAGDFVFVTRYANELTVKIKNTDFFESSPESIGQVKQILNPYLVGPSDMQYACYTAKESDGIRITYPEFFNSPFYDDLCTPNTTELNTIEHIKNDLKTAFCNKR